MTTTIFSRIKESISSDLHTMMDKKEQKNPMAALNQYLRQSEQEKDKVRKLIERQHKLRDQFSHEYLRAQDMADKRQKQATIAEKAGESDLQRFAEKEQADYQARADRMKASREEAIEQLTVMEQKYTDMKHKLKDMHLRRMELMGRENTARAHHQMNRVNTESFEKPFSRFEEMENYIDGLEQQVHRSYHEHTFDAKIAQLEKDMANKAEI